MTFVSKLFAAADKLTQVKPKTGTDPGLINNLPTDTSTTILSNLLNTTYFILGAAAVLVIVLSGFTFMTAAYDPSKVAMAKNATLYAIVGLIAVIAAFFVTQFVLQKF